MNIKLAIIGSRNFNSYELFKLTMKNLFPGGGFNITTVVSGGAKGADSLGKRWATENNIPYVEYLPDWNQFGKAAGMIRNTDIVKAADVILAFWDGESRGTAGAINIARKHNKTTFIIYYKKHEFFD